jgi:transcriptional regulator with XRE-family HTH domain
MLSNEIKGLVLVLRTSPKYRLSLSQMSQLSGLHESHISRFLNGAKVSQDTLDKLWAIIPPELKIEWFHRQEGSM